MNSSSDKISAEITNYPQNEAFVDGTVGNYLFQAKLLDTPSKYGINEGRISRLQIGNGRAGGAFFDSVLVNYDRGWDEKPNKDWAPYVDAVIQLLEGLPPRSGDENALG